MNENNDPYFDMPSVDTDETRYCANEWCDNELLPEDDENEPCANCRAEEAKTAAYYERAFRAAKDGLSNEEILDAYSDPADYQKRARMERDLK